MPAGALVIVIDHSGSMSEAIHNAPESKEHYANQAAILSLKSLQTKDYVGVIAFDTEPTWVVPLSENLHPDQTSQEISQITPAGGTSIYPALDAAYEALARLDSSQVPVKHIVLLTDGDSMPGDWAMVTSKMRAANISLSTVGVGDDADKNLLTSLAQMGRGKFYFIADPTVLPQVFIKEAMTLRATLIKEKTFTPRVRDQGSPVLGGIDALPPLTGLISTWPKANPEIVQPLVSDDADPLLSYWRVGLGQCAVFTSDAGDRWATQWTQWSGYSQIFSQLVRTIERGAATNLASARIITTAPDHSKLLVQAAGPQQQFANLSNVWAMLLSPDPHVPPRRIELSQSGPGSYSADITTPASGAYLATVHMDANNSGSTWIDTAYVAPSSPEMRDLESNEFNLTEIAQRTGGRLLNPFDPQADLFNRQGLTEPRISRPLTNYLIALAIILLLLDVAIRRIAIDRRMVASARDFVLARSPRRAPAPQPTAVLSAARKSKPIHVPDASPDIILPPSPAFDQSPVTTTVAEAPPSQSPDNPLDRLAAAKRRARQGFKN
jgi:hypothetical protein